MLPDGFSLMADKFLDQFEFQWLMGEELPANAMQFLFLPEELRSYYLQIKRDYLWAFQLDEENAMRMFKVSGHLEGNVYKAHSRAEARYVNYGQLDGWEVKAGIFINHSGVKRALFMYLEKRPDRWGSHNMQKLHMIKVDKVPQNVKASVDVWFGGRDPESPPPGLAPGAGANHQWVPRSGSRGSSRREFGPGRCEEAAGSHWTAAAGTWE
jgi:hypothetical protein